MYHTINKKKRKNTPNGEYNNFEKNNKVPAITHFGEIISLLRHTE